MTRDRYESFARVYDLLSGEWPIYRAGRIRGISDLHLHPGMAILDLGCGTGLNFGPVEDIIGPGGRIVGVDNSQAMLAQARRRVRRHGWSNVTLVRADATVMTPEGCTIDAVIATYALSVMPDWRTAWRSAAALAGPGGRVCIVDMQQPTGAARLLSPLARLACTVGGADINAHPWTALEQSTVGTTRASLRGGHIQVRTGTLKPPKKVTGQVL
ncbi:class I SAM-dependent methyltransferase [Specibacter cremeus]|uniref:class I SAM-dependent methyltransferase n=1 Tax=Specibacter cremeus TaxID=1629051 RepID=UPI000F78BC54|nr:methyltransferase domain-containing protein [Specibacter cremeus]